MYWYAIFVQTGKENYVKDWIEYYFKKSELKVFIPKKKMKEKRKGHYYEIVRTVFPSYIFLYTNMNIEKCNKLKRLPNVYRILKDDNYFTNIDQKEMNIILKLFGREEIADYTKIFYENDKVEIIDGPLCGFEGLIKKIDKRKNRATITFDLLGQERKIDLGVEILKKI